ncbi:hypothetical protein MAL08_12330 [Leptospira noguchii]|uniref:hypothetical protein n=1 Tax=Leptospira noguchii TaxID=28182 RepID=UPI001FB7C234|nr:hypothetical protein [Leptospira noguchii]UOG36889.1 hypothetical protein MAL08_12330 [Leptospira noguchii]
MSCPTQNVGNSTQRFPKGRVVGLYVLQRICRNSHRFNIEIQILVGLVMIGKRCALVHSSIPFAFVMPNSR